MFDTNAFDKIKENLDLLLNSGNEYYFTSIQKGEIEKIPKEKEKLKEDIFHVIDELNLNEDAPLMILNHYTTLNNSLLGGGEMSKLYYDLLNDNQNNVNDALIGAAAIYHNKILVTEDNQLLNKVNKKSGTAIKFEKFLTEIK